MLYCPFGTSRLRFEHIGLGGHEKDNNYYRNKNQSRPESQGHPGTGFLLHLLHTFNILLDLSGIPKSLIDINRLRFSFQVRRLFETTIYFTLISQTIVGLL